MNRDSARYKEKKKQDFFFYSILNLHSNNNNNKKRRDANTRQMCVRKNENLVTKEFLESASD